jgi:hypothetical protein
MRFKVRRNPDQLKRILIIAGAFAVFSILAFVFGGERLGVPLVVVSAVIVLLTSVEQSKLGWYYEIGDHDLIVRRTLKKYHIAGAAMVKVTTGGWPEIWKRVRRYWEGNFPRASENQQVALGRLIGFSSVPIPIRGSQPRGLDVFVLLLLRSGREYVLSPDNPEQFVRQIQRLMSRTASEDER